jgi:aldose sugar dehydrogenase
MSYASSRRMHLVTAFLGVVLLVAVSAGYALQAPAAPKGPDATGGKVVQTKDYQIRVATLAEGLSYPYSFVFLPDGSMLIAQLNGQLRMFRNGKLVPEPITGVPKVHYVPGRGGLMDLALHPKFAQNRWVYFTYDKEGPKGATPAVGRGTLNGNQLTEVKDIVVPDAWGHEDGHLGAYIRFTPDGLLYMSTAEREEPDRSQLMTDDAGKVLRLRDDGSVPPDNPYVGKAGHSPRIFTYGHRDVHAMTVHPKTGDVWTAEHGDEVNIERATTNYGWPYIAMSGPNKDKPAPTGVKLSPPYLGWRPGINVSGMFFYTGNVFPKWKGNLFIGGLAGQQVQRIAFAQDPPNTTPPATGETREPLFNIGARVRDTKEGPDGLIYFVTDEEKARLFRIEPVK